ncbi:hypothetical protein RHMOL_Rhmol07G0097400 [Rhododendron molle]|uniref:Uncharacterized protein n=1 Tax=Rhododendron molle TaxID=49168 RepID=A0ACC0MZK6_RHOML|nr:hypothetical protein RHMOL_Rhmol07G0097400 [Rhododendron molle]
MVICNAINMIDWFCDCALAFIIVFMLDVCRKGHSSLQPSRPGAFSFSKIVSDKELVRRTDSPKYLQLKRSGTLVGNSISSTNSNAKQPCPEELWRSASVSSTHSGRSMTRDVQPYSRKSKPLFKALFTMLKQKRDGKLCG